MERKSGKRAIVRERGKGLPAAQDKSRSPRPGVGEDPVIDHADAESPATLLDGFLSIVDPVNRYYSIVVHIDQWAKGQPIAHARISCIAEKVRVTLPCL